jgi:hypothetical protein
MLAELRSHRLDLELETLYRRRNAVLPLIRALVCYQREERLRTDMLPEDFAGRRVR